MAISPPSDLILDVSRAADPVNLAEATNRLRSISTGGSGEGFALAYAGATNRAGVSEGAFRTAGYEGPSEKSPAEKFEAMILGQFVETMLPDDSEAVFGSGTAGEIWKSMLAEQVANQLAASGGVGIAGLISETLEKGVKA
ncbi:rod-binding protein [Roseibium aggregatum]|uniref:rod-binding protein n=1 Tax=Roseibium aggregatum TaxID=187304 RepID=UPI003A970BDC